MGCKQLWYQHAFHVKQGHEDMWCACKCVCVFVYLFALCVVWHIFTEGCVLSLSFGVRPEAMSNWSLHTFRLDSHWHARPWLSSLCHEKGKEVTHKHAFYFAERGKFIAPYFFLCFPSLCRSSVRALREYNRLFYIWGNKLFNHGRGIYKTYRKVKTVFQLYDTARHNILRLLKKLI